MQGPNAPTLTHLLKNHKEQVKDSTDRYLQYFEHDLEPDALEKKRKENYAEITTNYYDIATDFFEYGWGESFHFAPLRKGESREHSIAKHEYFLALKLQLQAGQTVLVG